MPLLLPLLVACSGSSDDAEPPTWHADVHPIVGEHCASCHVEGGNTPMALGDYDTVSAWAEASLVAMDEGRMPPWMPDPDCRHYLDERVLPADDLETFRRWVEADMPEGDAATAATVPMDEPVSIVPTHVLNGTDGYVSSAVTEDDYRCFVMDLDLPTDRYVRATHVVPGVPQVHHVLVYAMGPDLVDDVQAADDADEGPGYTCFGAPLDTTTSLPVQIGAWVPGSAPGVYPDDLSARIVAGSTVVVQVHYSAVAGAPQADHDTSVELVLQEEPTDFLSAALPLAVLDLDIPAGAAAATANQLFTNYSTDPITVVAMAAHMHLLGTSIEVDVVRPGEPAECALDIPDWDFAWQQRYVLEADQPVVLLPGEGLDVTCTYDNSEANQAVVDGEPQAPQDVEWGDGTLDEMCIAYVVTRAPFTPAVDPALAACSGIDDCADCNGDADCALTCDTAGSDCTVCALTELETCSVAPCGLAWLGVLGCVEECIINSVVFAGTVGACMDDRCSPAATDALTACLDSTLEPGGACEGAIETGCK